jgi:hypothetical protein
MLRYLTHHTTVPPTTFRGQFEFRSTIRMSIQCNCVCHLEYSLQKRDRMTMQQFVSIWTTVSQASELYYCTLSILWHVALELKKKRKKKLSDKFNHGTSRSVYNSRSTGSWIHFHQIERRQAMYCTYNLTPKRDPVTIVAAKKQWALHILIVRL